MMAISRILSVAMLLAFGAVLMGIAVTADRPATGTALAGGVTQGQRISN